MTWLTMTQPHRAIAPFPRQRPLQDIVGCDQAATEKSTALTYGGGDDAEIS
jgi:hypothetical protein